MKTTPGHIRISDAMWKRLHPSEGHTFALLSYYGNMIDSYDTLDEARAHLDEFLVEPDSADGIGLLEYDAQGMCVRRHWPEG